MTSSIDTIEGHARAADPTISPVYKRSDGKERIVVSAWVDAETARLLDALAELDEVTRSTLVRDAVQGLVARRTVPVRRGVQGGARVPRRGMVAARSSSAARRSA